MIDLITSLINRADNPKEVVAVVVLLCCVAASPFVALAWWVRRVRR